MQGAECGMRSGAEDGGECGIGVLMHEVAFVNGMLMARR
jgi:hypothetical protein